MPPIATVIVSSSPLTLVKVTLALQSLTEIRICGQANDLSGAYVQVEQTEPQLVIVGSELTRHPSFPGLLAMFRVMNISWIKLEPEGALLDSDTTVPVVSPSLTGSALRSVILNSISRPAPPLPFQPNSPRPKPRPTGDRRDRIILIGASTGGIDALLRLLSVFPADCPPTAIVQHTGSAFSDSLIKLLARCCAARVETAKSGILLLPGTVVVGAGIPGHFRLSSGAPPKVEVTAGAPVMGHLPSVDELFRSAVPFAPRVVAALLTGMGRDGAQGLLELRNAGADTMVQDEESSVVYGMPRAAWQLGAAQTQRPLDRIGPELLARATNTAERSEQQPTLTP